MDDIAEQTAELLKAKDDAEQHIQAVEQEVEKMLESEAKLKEDLERSQDEFKNEQMATLVLESEVTELRAEFERLKALALVEGQRHVQLQRTVREEKMEGALRYLITHGREVHRADRVHSTLLDVRQQLDTQNVSALPPLRIERKAESALADPGLDANV
jgi:chromosome segregation ATPase